MVMDFWWCSLCSIYRCQIIIFHIYVWTLWWVTLIMWSVTYQMNIMVSDNHITLFSASHWLVSVHLLFSSRTDSKVHEDVVSLSSSDEFTWLFTKLDSWNREQANKDESAVKNQTKDSGSKTGKWLWTIGWRYPDEVIKK